MIKVAYISPAFFSNVDVPYVNALKDYADLYYFVNVPYDGKGYAINIKNVPAKSGIYPAREFDELKVYEDTIDLDKTFIVYRKSKSSFSFSAIWVTILLLFRLLRMNIDVYHFTEPFTFCEWLLYLLRRKAVLSVHDPFMHSSNKRKLIPLYRRLAFTFFKKFIIFNDAQKNDFIAAHNLKQTQVFSSHLSSYTYLRLYGGSAAPKYRYALFIGTIRSHKGIEYLMDAMKIVHQKYPEYKLVIAGAGDFYFDISSYQKEDYYVIINRFLDDCEQVPLIENSDFVVCPYIDATQSGVIMSAYAFHKPCVATNVGGLPEMLGDGKLGLLVEPKNVEQLAQAMVHMIENEPMRKQFADEIKDEYEKGNMSWNVIAQDICNNVYKSR